jgi:hypothetical protein
MMTENDFVRLDDAVAKFLDLRDRGLELVERAASAARRLVPAAEWPAAREVFDGAVAAIVRDFDRDIESLVAESRDVSKKD